MEASGPPSGPMEPGTQQEEAPAKTNVECMGQSARGGRRVRQSHKLNAGQKKSASLNWNHVWYKQFFFGKGV